MTRRDPLTADLFHNIPRPAPALPASMDHRAELSELISQMLADARRLNPALDRYAIAANMSRLTDHDVSKLMLDGYTSPARDAFNLPLWLVPALETACESTALTEWLAAKRGGRVLLGAAALDAEIGRLRADLADGKERLKQLEDLQRRVR